eukprot:m.26050 g.26050  ORF g.26050 m.26050 type:complete len:266 (-) comp15260_c0_seq2:122-919(-)
MENLYEPLEVAAGNLVKAMMSFQVGAERASTSRADKNTQTVAQQRFREWVANLQSEYKVALEETSSILEPQQLDDSSSADVDETERLLLQKIDDLKLELRECAFERSRETNLVERLRHTTITSAALFPDDNAVATFHLDPHTATSISTRVLQRDKLNEELLLLRKNLSAKTDELLAVQESNKRLILRNRAAMRHLKQMQTNQTDIVGEHMDDTVDAANEAFSQQLQFNAILRHTFQGIIVGSGVDWAGDPQLQNTLISLAKPPDV